MIEIFTFMAYIDSLNLKPVLPVKNICFNGPVMISSLSTAILTSKKKTSLTGFLYVMYKFYIYLF